jgi:ABC-type transporter Mla subunit MlaD
MALSLNPIGDVLARVDRALAAVDGVVGRVDGTLAEATDVLSDVRSLLRELETELALLHRLPEIAAQLEEVHRIVTRDDRGGSGQTERRDGDVVASGEQRSSDEAGGGVVDRDA